MDLLTQALSLTNAKHETTLTLLEQLIPFQKPTLTSFCYFITEQCTNLVTTTISPQAKQMAKQIKQNYEKQKKWSIKINFRAEKIY